MFSFTWPSAARNDKPIPGKTNFMPPAAPVTHIPMVNKMKRKREDNSPASAKLNLPPPKRSEPMEHVQISTPNAQCAPLPTAVTEVYGRESIRPVALDASQESASDITPATSNAQVLDQSGHAKPIHDTNNDDGQDCAQISSVAPINQKALREAIEAQFGLEILLKHKELRLIDQEFAKCQVALEQLRRCQVVPYPAVSSDPEAMQVASNGSGTSFNNHAPYAPPWGVADGPYSRHYRRWLIPDSAFDDTVAEDVQVRTISGKRMPERATRGSKSETVINTGNSRSQRGSNNNVRLKALPHGYPEPKEEKGPMIVKRGSDGKMVKLVCLDCRRSNFNSAQGFINHCRIAHSRQFLSHDAAIQASGEEIDVDAEGGVGEVNNVPQATASSALVHPLIRSSAHLARSVSTEHSTSSRKRLQASSSGANQTAAAIRTPQPMSTPQQTNPPNLTDPPRFTPSPQTPHLSALFAKIGRGGDLDDLVKQVKAKPEIDLELSSDEEDEDVMEVAAGTTNAPQSRSTRGVVRDGHLPARQTKSPTPSEQSPVQQSFSNNSQKPANLSKMSLHHAYPSPYHSDDAHEEHSSAIHTESNAFNLSPNTIEAHTAPSLVSDDGDYENAHSDSESPSSAEADDDEDHYIHAELMDHDEMDLREGSSAAHHLGLGGKPHAPAVRRRSSAMRPPMVLQNGEAQQRHVSFASPARRQRRDSRTAGEK